MPAVSNTEPAAEPRLSGGAAAPGLGPRAARGGGALLARHAVTFIANVVGGLVLARRFGPETMGLYFAAATLFQIGRQLVDFGTTPGLIRSGDPTTEARAAWLHRAVAGGIVVAAMVALASGATRHYAPARATDLTWLVTAGVVAALAWVWQVLPVARLERQLDYVRVGRIEVLEPVVFNAVAVGLGFSGVGVMALTIALALRGLVPAVAAMRALRVPRPPFPGWAAVRAEARKCWPLVGAQATLWAILAAPALVVGPLAGAAELGRAQLAASLLGGAGIPAAVFQRVSFAGFAQLGASPERLGPGVARALGLLALVSLPLLGALAAFSSIWVPPLLGEEWRTMAKVVALGALPAALAGYFSIVYAAVLALGMNRLVFVQNLVHAVVYIGVMAALAGRWGALAVPAAHLAAVPAGFLYLRGFARRSELPRAPGALWALAGEAAITGVAGMLVTRGAVLLALGLWTAAHAIVLPIAARRARVGRVLRDALGRS